MAMEPFIQEFTGTGSWAPLLTGPQSGFKGTLTADSANAGNILIRVKTSANTSKLIPGEYMTIDPMCNLTDIQIQGNTYVLKALGTTDIGW